MCQSCEVLYINGVKCHEIGCPEAAFEPKECAECGTVFTPEHRIDVVCGHSCAVAYSGIGCDCEECSGELETLNIATGLAAPSGDGVATWRRYDGIFTEFVEGKPCVECVSALPVDRHSICEAMLNH